MPGSFGNSFVKLILNSPFHFLMGGSFAVITLTGRRTGKLISTPINVQPTGEGLTVLSTRERTWWRNLESGRPAQLRHKGTSFPVPAELIMDPLQVAADLKAYFRQYPAYAKYFKLSPGEDGLPEQKDLERLAAERLVIHLYPIMEYNNK